MTEQSIQAGPPAPRPAGPETVAKEIPSLVKPGPSVVWQFLTFLASLKLTVILFALSIILVFYGTWVQKEMGIWTAMDQYFRNPFLVWIPFRVFSMYLVDWPISIPFPGGWLLGGLLFTNLIAAHAVRFKISWKRSGILLIHSGLVVMMLSEFFTGIAAVEGNIVLKPGDAVNYVSHNRLTELALVQYLDSKNEDVVVIPQDKIRHPGLVRHEYLPFDVEVVRYMANSAFVKPDKSNPATKGIGLREMAIDRSEVTGVETGGENDIASAYVTLKKKGTGETLGTYLVSLEIQPQPVSDGDQVYYLSLRQKRLYKSYTLHLINLRHDKYMGTERPKNYSSLVRLVDPQTGDDREVLISMNDPLRHRGETFYQSNMKDGITGLQVVRNYFWLLPYISCGMVSMGMLIHFGIILIRFLEKVQV